MLKNIEVEIRGLLNNQEYKDLIDFLDKNGTNKELDNRNTVFFIIPGKTLKVSQQIDKNITKIALKMGDIVKDDAQTEYEIFFTLEQYDIAVNIFKNLGFNDIQITTQKRVNYMYKGASFSIKWSKDWGYHFEIDTVINEEQSIDDTKKKLLKLARSLNLSIMNEEEFGRRCAEIDAKHALFNINQNGN